MSYFLSTEWLEAILQEFIIYQAGWYPPQQDGSGWSLTPLGSPGEKKVNRDALASSVTTGLLPLSLESALHMITNETSRDVPLPSHANRQLFISLPLSLFFFTHSTTLVIHRIPAGLGEHRQGKHEMLWHKSDGTADCTADIQNTGIYLHRKDDMIFNWLVCIFLK